MPHPWLYAVLMIAWIGSEAIIDRRYRSAGKGESRDRGTLRLLHRVIALCGLVALLLGMARIARWPAEWIAPLYGVGIVMMAAGLALRWWAVRTLDRWFTVDVAIRAGHQLVRHGPYRVLRHPAYTGALMLVYGMGLVLGSWAAFLVMAVPGTWAFLQRIRVEEAALAEGFPAAWPAYAATTKRLVPGVW